MVTVFRYVDILSTVFFIGVFVHYFGVRNEKTPRGEVRLPAFIMLIGSVCGAFFSIFSVAASFETPIWEPAPLWAIITFNSFVLLGLVLSLAPIMIKITYDSSGIEKRDLFGVKRRYGWRELTELEDLHGDIRLYFGKRRFSVDEMSCGIEELTAYAQKQYRAIRGSALPLRPVSKRSLFKGHVKNPGGFVFFYALIYLLLFGFLTVAIIDSRPMKAEELAYAVITPTGHELSDGDLKIYAADDTPYVLKDYKKYITDADGLIALVGAGDRMEVGYVGHEDAKEDPRRTICSIEEEGGEKFRTLEMSNEMMRDDIRIVKTLIGGLTVMWTVYCVMSIKVGRDPDKYSPRTVGFFFKDGYIS